MSYYSDNDLKRRKDLAPRVTGEFLETLVLAVKTCGWEVDHIESANFVEWCHELAEKECPDLEPYPYD